MMLSRIEREAWLLREIAANHRAGADVLDADFVREYAEHTGATTVATFYGAPRCPRLGRDLSRLAKDGRLTRQRVGLSGGGWMAGFPKWVWSYTAKKVP